MPEVLFPLDSTKKFTDQQILGHNRWHYAIPPAVQVKPGDTFRVHCREWFDGAIVNDDSADDILNAPLAQWRVFRSTAISGECVPPPKMRRLSICGGPGPGVAACAGRSAKAGPGRRLHALRDKVYRRDVLWRRD